MIRKPFDQVVSFYENLCKPLYMSADAIEQQWPGSPCRFIPHWARQLVIQADFQEYIRRVYEGQEGPVHLMRELCAWLDDASGNLGRIIVLRFENLEHDFSVLSQELDLKGSLPWRNASQTRDL